MKVAVVGSGVSGLAATWLLNEYSEHQVHLFESDARPGGHANTVPYHVLGQSIDVDTGFIVFNPVTYPNFLRFLGLHPDVKILPTQMTFSVSRDGGVFEWAGSSLASLFCQPSRLLDPKMWRLVYDVLRFNACARRLAMDGGGAKECSIGDYLAQHGYSDTFRHDYLIPMTAAVWSTSPDKCAMQFPARTLIQFMSNHHLLQITARPAWLTIQGGSRRYVDAILSKLPPSQLHLSTPIVEVSTPQEGTVHITSADGRLHPFDRVILACHSDMALSLIQAGDGVTQQEVQILKRFAWNKNEAVLHNDTRLMPKRRLAWSCWNYLTFSGVDNKGSRKANVDKVSLTYNMNDLQHIPAEKYGAVLVTLNPPMAPAPGAVSARFRYDHPVLNGEAVVSQKQMPTIQGCRGILYAGAWLGYGFHEDGFTSGLRAVAEHIPGVRVPFEIQTADRRPKPVLAAYVFDFLESSGIRVVAGIILSIVLSSLAALLGVQNGGH